MSPGGCHEYYQVVVFPLFLACFFTVANTDVNINTATKQELITGLKNIGPSKAQSIVEFREKFGNFHNIEDLEEVSGIGPATIELNREILTVGEQKNQTTKK